MTVHLCEDYGLGYLEQPWTVPGDWNIHFTVDWTPLLLRTVPRNGPPALGTFGARAAGQGSIDTWTVRLYVPTHDHASTRGHAGPWPVAGRGCCGSRSSWRHNHGKLMIGVCADVIYFGRSTPPTLPKSQKLKIHKKLE